MERIIVSSIVVILISFSLSFLVNSILKTNVKEVIANLDKDHIIVHLPNAYKWIGLACAIFFAALLISSQYFFADTRSTFTDLVSSILALLGMWLFYYACVWRIEIYKSRDYFVIRNSLWVTKKVSYSDITHYRRDTNNLKLYAKTRTYTIDRKSTNIEFLMIEFSKHKISRLSTYTKDHFNGYIEDPTTLFFELWLVAGIMFCISAYLLHWGLTYERVDDDDRVLLIAFSMLILVYSITMPLITMYVVKRTEKYPRLARLLVKPDRFSRK